MTVINYCFLQCVESWQFASYLVSLFSCTSFLFSFSSSSSSVSLSLSSHLPLHLLRITLSSPPLPSSPSSLSPCLSSSPLLHSPFPSFLISDFLTSSPLISSPLPLSLPLSPCLLLPYSLISSLSLSHFPFPLILFSVKACSVCSVFASPPPLSSLSPHHNYPLISPLPSFPSSSPPHLPSHFPSPSHLLILYLLTSLFLFLLILSLPLFPHLLLLIPSPLLSPHLLPPYSHISPLPSSPSSSSPHLSSPPALLPLRGPAPFPRARSCLLSEAALAFCPVLLLLLIALVLSVIYCCWARC